jgi:hypothetical protein
MLAECGHKIGTEWFKRGQGIVKIKKNQMTHKYVLKLLCPDCLKKRVYK